jgi:Xaa-Pro aminopeptidase
MDTRAANISIDEYQERRRRVLDALDGAAAVVFAGTDPGSDYPLGRWKTARSFWYLTGLDYEGGAAVVFDPSAEDPRRRISLFLRSRDPEIERWDGAREPLDSALRAKTGFDSIFRTASMPDRLTDAARRCRRLACLHPFAAYTGQVSPDLAVFKKITDHVPGVAIEDRARLLPSMRAVKSPAELALMRQAVAISAAGFRAALRALRPGVTEKSIADLMTGEFAAMGAESAFEAIVGSGPNGAVLHYVDLDRTIEDGELVVIDYGAAFGGYASDVTRTFPASGAFTAEQRELYEIVLEANTQAIAATRPGATITDIQNAAREVITKAGYEDMFIHGIGHQLGIETHDATPDGPLVAGMVITIEPGIYLPDRGIGIRIEDDVLLAEDGAVNLTSAIPKTVEDIETAMGADHRST